MNELITTQPNTVLVAENERPIRELIQQILEGEGFNVQTADSSTQAADMIRRAEPPFPVIISDYGESGPGNTDVINAVLGALATRDLTDARSQRTVVIGCTGSNETARQAVATHPAATHILEVIDKPFDLDDFIRTVGRAFGR